MDTLIFPLLLQVILIALNAIFACAEIAVIALNETKVQILAEEGNRKAKKLKVFTEQPARFLATIQVAITLSGFLGSAFAADNFSELLVNWLVDLASRSRSRRWTPSPSFSSPSFCPTSP